MENDKKKIQNYLYFQMKNDQVSVEGIVTIAKMIHGDDAAKIKLAADIANDCVGVTDPNPCEAADKVLQCSKRAHEARGLKFGEW